MSHPTPLNHSSGERGSIVAETTAALALIGIAIFVAGALLNLQPLTSDRLDARRDVLRAAEATIEGARSGSVPLATGRVRPLPLTLDRSVRVDLEVESLSPGLFQVSAIARTTVRDRVVHQRLSTRVWRPR